MIKVQERLGMEKAYLIIAKDVYNKPSAKVILNGEKLEASPLKSRKRRAANYPHFFQYTFGGTGSSNKEREKLKRYKDEKKSSTENMSYISEIPPNSTIKLIEIIDNIDKVVEYKINLKISSLSIQYQQTH